MNKGFDAVGVSATVLAALLSTWFTALSATDAQKTAGPAEDTRSSKFHPIFIVSVDALTVGAKAAVEPIFLTDGKEIIPFYDYCRALHGGGIPGSEETVRKTKANWEQYKKTLAQKGAPEIRALAPFCRGEAFALPAEKYFLLDNLGQRIRIGSVEFGTDDDTPDYVRRMRLPPHMSVSGTAKIVRVDQLEKEILSLVSSRATGKHYLLMAAREGVLSAITPVVRPTVREADVLLAQAATTAREKQGTRWWDGQQIQPSQKIIVGGDPQLRSPLFADFDNDGSIDVVVHMRSSQEATAENIGLPKGRWLARGVISGNKAAKIDYAEILDVTLSPEQPSLWVQEFPYFVAVGYLHINGCFYLLAERSSPYESHFAFGLFPLPREAGHCVNTLLSRVAPKH